MKNKLLLLFLFVFCNMTSVHPAGISAATNNVYIAVSGMPTNDLVRFDSPLVYMPFCDTGQIEVQCALNPAYSARISLTDSNGQEVSKTRIGIRFGSKFDNQKNYSDGRPYPFIASGSYANRMGMGGGRPFSNYPVTSDYWLRPEDLFEIETPGIYTLEIEMQMFLVHKNTNPWNYELVRFSPIRIKVIKPATK